MSFTSLISMAAAATAVPMIDNGNGFVSISSTFPTSLPSPTSHLASYPPAGAGQSHHGDTHHGDNTGECRLLGPFSLFVQAALGALALLSLVYKRWKERPQRPVKVWAFDVSKQVFGSAMLHLANLLMSMFSAGQLELTSTYKPNPCSFYLLNLGIDTTLGIPILIFILFILNRLASYTSLANPPESIESGNYGNPPRAAWWFKQAFIYFVGLLGMKICVFFLIQLLPFIVQVGDWALRWTEGNAAVQIFFVMLLFPVIMNAIQYYIIDTFIKKPLSPSLEMLGEEDEAEDALLDDDYDHRNPLLGHLEDDETVQSDDESSGRHLGQPAQNNEYKSTADGGYHYPSSGSTSSSSSHGEYDAMASSTKLGFQHKDS